MISHEPDHRHSMDAWRSGHGAGDNLDVWSIGMNSDYRRKRDEILQWTIYRAKESPVVISQAAKALDALVLEVVNTVIEKIEYRLPSPNKIDSYDRADIIEYLDEVQEEIDTQRQQAKELINPGEETE